jgi:hypothetical protein
MRAIGLVFLTLGYAASLLGAADWGQSVVASQPASAPSAANTVGNHSRETEHATGTDGGTRVEKTSDDQQNNRSISGNKLPTSNTSLSKSNRPNELPNRRQRSAAEDSKNFHRPGSDKSGGAAINGFTRNETVNHASSNRAPSAAQASVPSLGNVRHRGPNPAIISGAASSNTRKTAALDGTHMNRKHTGD